MSKTIKFFLFVILLTTSCSPGNWDKKSQEYRGVCTLPECSIELINIVCSEYPYMPNTTIPNKILYNLGCVFCPDEAFLSARINEFCEKMVAKCLN